MELKFQQSEAIAARRRWILVLVDSADGVTGLTAQTGTVKISKNGAASAASTNSLVEVDVANMPGHYYIELTAAELSDLGMISIYYKAAGSLAFHDRAYVTYDDPFARHGGFAQGGGGKAEKFTAAMANDIAERVWKVKLQDRAAGDILLSKSDFNHKEDTVKVDQTELTSSLETMAAGLKGLIERDTGLTSLQEFASQIEQAYNATSTQASESMMQKYDQVENRIKNILPDFQAFNKVISELVPKMSNMSSQFDKIKSTGEELNQLKETAKEFNTIKNDFMTLKDLMAEFSSKVNEIGDMDRRFAALSGNLQAESLKEIADKMAATEKSLKETAAKILQALVQAKYDIMQELTPNK